MARYGLDRTPGHVMAEMAPLERAITAGEKPLPDDVRAFGLTKFGADYMAAKDAEMVTYLAEKRTLLATLKAELDVVDAIACPPLSRHRPVAGADLPHPPRHPRVLRLRGVRPSPPRSRLTIARPAKRGYHASVRTGVRPRESTLRS